MTLEAFRHCKNVSKATWVFCADFELPYAGDCGIKDRILSAKIALRYLQSALYLATFSICVISTVRSPFSSRISKKL